MVGAATVGLGLEKIYGRAVVHDGVPAAMNFFLGSVVLLAAAGDIRMLVRGGISGTPRIARHLWRMCFALFIAAGSLFLGRHHLFPAVLRRTGALFLLTVFPLLLMVFWLFRIRRTSAYKRKAAPVRDNVSAARA